MKIDVILRQTTGVELVDIGIDSMRLPLMTKDEAIELAARIAFMADGNLVSVYSPNPPVVGWNFNSKFHAAYAKLMENPEWKPSNAFTD